jgi:transcriptional regulator with XRE-family HTH domain
MKKLQYHRERAGMVIVELAAKAGVSMPTIRKIEDGKATNVQARIQRGLAKALGLKPSDLFNPNGYAK